jgi:cadmium resistance protein CadD (predicted permease)
LELVGLAIALFASTNIDDMFVLVGFFSDPKFRQKEVVTGQFVGIAVLFVLCLAGSLLTLVISRAYVGLFGIVPIALGVMKLVDLFRNRSAKQEELEHPTKSGKFARSTAVALITLANGADNIGVYLPTFAIHSWYQIGIFAVVFALMTGLWCFFAHWLVHHPSIGAPIRHYGHRTTPAVLIGLGALIMYEAGSFGLLI